MAGVGGEVAPLMCVGTRLTVDGEAFLESYPSNLRESLVDEFPVFFQGEEFKPIDEDVDQDCQAGEEQMNRGCGITPEATGLHGRGRVGGGTKSAGKDQHQKAQDHQRNGAIFDLLIS